MMGAIHGRLLGYWLEIRSTFWFVPALMALGAILLAFLTVELDQRIGETLAGNDILVYIGTPAGARGLLSTIAASMITVAGVVFSITVVALAQASQQYGPRLLRNFMRDTPNQVVLGTFIATFLYSLLVLRTVRGVEDAQFVPQVSMVVALLLTLTSIGVLIFFIHHAAASLQATTVVMSAVRELDRSIERIFPESAGAGAREEGSADSGLPEDFDERAVEVSAGKSGYLQAIDVEGLLRIADGDDLILRLEHNPGDFVIEHSTIARLWPSAAHSEELDRRINEAFTLGSDRTSLQDVEYSVDQLVEIALRALSPGINDPFTAINCIDRLGVALMKLMEKDFPSAHRYAGGRLRLVAKPVTFRGVVDAAFTQIRQNGREQPAITIRLLETIAALAERVRTDEQRDALLLHARATERAATSVDLDDSDRQTIEERYDNAVRALTRRQSAQKDARVRAR
jgi:uncharacterized membrane protein